MSLGVGDLVFVVLRNGDDEIPVTGWAVDTVECDVVIGTDASIVADFESLFLGWGQRLGQSQTLVLARVHGRRCPSANW